MNDAEQLLKSMHNALSIKFGTDVPYRIGPVTAERVGYAQDRCVVCEVFCRQEHITALVPIVRQRVYAELGERGWGPDDIEFRPSVMLASLRRHKFTDENESSPSHGKGKYGEKHQFRFRMGTALGEATFKQFGCSYAKLPEHPSRAGAS